MSASPDKFQVATVVSRKDYAPDLWSIRVLPEAKLDFKPGQYATLGLQDSVHRLHEKPYSIVSSPVEDEIEFFFELVPQGELTPVLHALKKGDTVMMRRQAKGLFTLDEKSGHKRHFMVSTVTGVAPYVSMARTLAAQIKAGQPTDLLFVMLQSASRSWELGYHEEMAGLAKTGNWLHYIPTISRPWEDPAWQGEKGRAEDVVRKYLDQFGLEPAQTTFYGCGHPTMIENSKGILKRCGFTKESIREEVYWVPKK